MTRNILLVEDNEGDIELTRIAFEENKLECHLAVAHDGAEGLDYLRCRPPFIDAVTPQLILLDLNMPRMNGKQFLEAIKFDQQLKHIPVMVLTSSQAQHDIRDCYHLHTNGYMIKPTNAKERQGLARCVSDFLNHTDSSAFTTH